MEDSITGMLYDGTDFIITNKRWIHVLEHHPELRDSMEVALEAVRNPDECYLDPRGCIIL